VGGGGGGSKSPNHLLNLAEREGKGKREGEQVIWGNPGGKKEEQAKQPMLFRFPLLSGEREKGKKTKPQ